MYGHYASIDRTRLFLLIIEKCYGNALWFLHEATVPSIVRFPIQNFLTPVNSNIAAARERDGYREKKPNTTVTWRTKEHCQMGALFVASGEKGGEVDDSIR